MFCNKCGNKIGEGAAFCNKCGAKLVADSTGEDAKVVENINPQSLASDTFSMSDNAQNGRVNDLPTTSVTLSDNTELLKKLIGRNSDYYLKQFAKIERGEKSFNWTVFFFSPIVLLYRKQYSCFAKLLLPVIMLFLSLPLLVSLIFATISYEVMIVTLTIGIITPIYGLSVAIICGKKFNKWYKMNLDKVIAENNFISDNITVNHTAIKKFQPSALVLIVCMLLLFGFSYAINHMIMSSLLNSLSTYETATLGQLDTDVNAPSSQLDVPQEPEPASSWITVAGGGSSISIPSQWIGYWTGETSTAGNSLQISNENGSIELGTFITRPEIIDEVFASEHNSFLFNDGSQGAIQELDDRIYFYHKDANVGVALVYGSNRDLLRNNEDLIMSVVKTLTTETESSSETVSTIPTDDFDLMGAKVTANNVNVRNAPNTQGNVLFQITNPDGEYLVIYKNPIKSSNGEEWYRIVYRWFEDEEDAGFYSVDGSAHIIGNFLTIEPLSPKIIEDYGLRDYWEMNKAAILNP